MHDGNEDGYQDSGDDTGHSFVAAAVAEWGVLFTDLSSTVCISTAAGYSWSRRRNLMQLVCVAACSSCNII